MVESEAMVTNTLSFVGRRILPSWLSLAFTFCAVLFVAESLQAQPGMRREMREQRQQPNEDGTGGPGMAGKMGVNNYHAYFPWHDLEKLMGREVTAAEREQLTEVAKAAGLSMNAATENFAKKISEISGLDQNTAQRLLPKMARPGKMQAMERRGRVEDKIFERLYETIERHTGEKLRSTDKKKIEKAQDEMVEAYAEAMEVFAKKVSDIVGVSERKVKEIMPLV